MTNDTGHSGPPAWTGIAAMAAGALCVGLAPIGLRLGLSQGELGAQAIAMWRYIFALPILLLLLLGIERRGPVRPIPAIIAAGALFALDIGLWHAALERTTVANATFIVNLGSIGVGFLAWVFLKERPAMMWGLAVAIAVGGAALLSLGGPAEGKTDLTGDMLAVGAAVMVSGYLLLSKIARLRLGALDALVWLTATEIAVAALIVWGAGEAFLPTSPAGFAAPLFLGIIVHVGGQGLIVFGLGRTPAAVAGVLMLLQPVMAAAISWNLFDEPLSGLQGLGGMMILAGCYLAQRRTPPAINPVPDRQI